MQVPGVYFTEFFSPFASDTRKRIMIGLTLYHKEEGWVAEICDVEATFLHPNMEVEMFIGSTESILELGTITKEYL